MMSSWKVSLTFKHGYFFTQNLYANRKRIKSSKYYKECEETQLILEKIEYEEGNKLKYITTTGEEIKEFRKGWGAENLQKVIDDFKENDAPLVNNDDVVPEEVVDENE